MFKGDMQENLRYFKIKYLSLDNTHVYNTNFFIATVSTTEYPSVFNYICVTGIDSEKQDVLPVTFTPSDL